MKEISDKKKVKANISLKKILILFVVIIIIALGSFVGGILFINSQKSNEVVPAMTSAVLSNQLESISEIATVKYLYTNMGKFEDSSEIKGVTIPFTSKSFILSYDGTIKAGINAELLKIEVSNNLITVNMPSAKILSHEIDNDSVQVFDQTKNIFNQIEIEDYTAFSTQQEAEMEQRAIDNGILAEANKKAETVIRDILNANKEINSLYTIKFIYLS